MAFHACVALSILTFAFLAPFLSLSPLHISFLTPFFSLFCSSGNRKKWKKKKLHLEVEGAPRPSQGLLCLIQHHSLACIQDSRKKKKCKFVARWTFQGQRLSAQGAKGTSSFRRWRKNDNFGAEIRSIQSGSYPSPLPILNSSRKSRLQLDKGTEKPPPFLPDQKRVQRYFSNCCSSSCPISRCRFYATLYACHSQRKSRSEKRQYSITASHHPFCALC